MAYRSWPRYEPDELKAVEAVLRSGRVNYWTGDEGRRFESEYAEHCRVRYAVALANGTLALEAALTASGLEPGDEVIVTPRTFIASASTPVLRGLRPVFADVDRESGNLDPDSVQAALTSRTRAIIAVHLAGWPCELERLRELADHHELILIEDCAQAHGALYRGHAVGTVGHIGCFSFCQDKIISTGGEGGMVVTDDETIWRRVWSLKDHGKSWEAVHQREHPPGFRWLHEDFGSNWRLTEVQSAIGRVQLRKLESWVERRRVHAQRMSTALAPLLGLRVPQPPAHVRHSCYRFYAYVRPERLKPGCSRDRILGAFAMRGIPAMSGSCSEVYLEKCFTKAGLAPRGRLPVARELGETSLAFPVDHTVTEEEVERWCAVVADVMAEATAD
ncbi:MAG: DegT/DnrJ/EryC1/StrS aminotransferase family protein [Thermoleophilia bacterium]